MIFDIIFYSYSLNITSNTTFKVAQIIVLVCKFLEKKEIDLKHNIYSKILKEADFVLTNFQRKSKNSETNIETLNLLIALKKMDDSYLFSEKRLKELFRIEKKEDLLKLNYFHLVTLIYYIDSKPIFDNLKLSIEENIILRFKLDEDPFSKSDLTMLFFDTICCPFISTKSKRLLIKEAKYCKNSDSNVIIDNQINAIQEQGKWFMDWDIDIDLERVLKKKEWGSSY